MSNGRKEITIEDVKELRKQFTEYTKTAEQHEFPMLVTIDVRMLQTLKRYEEAGRVTDQDDARAMFFVVLKIIGGDYKPYAKDFEG